MEQDNESLKKEQGTEVDGQTYVQTLISICGEEATLRELVSAVGNRKDLFRRWNKIIEIQRFTLYTVEQIQKTTRWFGPPDGVLGLPPAHAGSREDLDSE